MASPTDLMAQIHAKGGGPATAADEDSNGRPAKIVPPAGLMAALQARKPPEIPPPGRGAPPGLRAALQARQQQDKMPRGPPPSPPPAPELPPGQFFLYDESNEAFLFGDTTQAPKLADDVYGNVDTDIVVPLAPCVYRMTDYTYLKKEPILLQRCILKLGVLRCLARECDNLNHLLWHRFNPEEARPPTLLQMWEDDSERMEMDTSQQSCTRSGGGGSDVVRSMEEAELGKARFMELLSNCGVYQKVSELILQRAAEAADNVKAKKKTKRISNGDKSGNNNNPYRIPQVRVDGLKEFLAEIENRDTSLKQAREEIAETQTVSFFPGLGELFCPGSKLICFPEGMEGSPLGCSCVQSWYAEELNKATGKVKRRFVLVLEFIVSVGDELVFVAASDVYPEFHDPTRNVPLKDLTHRKLHTAEDSVLLKRLQQRGEFYASVATHNHYLEYHPHSFFPIIGAGWKNNAVRPLSKGGRVMVDVKRGILEGHLPVRGTSDGMSDTVKEAIKLFEQSKRTGVAVPFRTCILPGFGANQISKKKKLQMGLLTEQGDSDRHHLWQSWPMLTGFSFTARVWGKLLLGMPKLIPCMSSPSSPVFNTSFHDSRAMLASLRRPSIKKFGVEIGGLGGEGSCGNCGYIKFQEHAFEQLVLSEDKKELIRAVARNAGGGSKWDVDDDDDGSLDSLDNDEDIALDVVANKGAASIFLLHGPPGCGKTLTAEAISELLKKPLYIVTAGDLGITATEVEKTLGSVLELCQTWDALVLIDEADIFLEARNSTEIQRNALVCVMLRLLEYYSGCLFLSSNRSAGSIDAAIASRITVMLGYPPLDAEGRSKVWKNLVELVPTQPIDPDTGIILEKVATNPRKASKYRLEFTEEDYQSLGTGYQLNGRQIKNSIVLARALARERGMPLSLPILKRAVTAVTGEEPAM